jgi:hypothetical protein
MPLQIKLPATPHVWVLISDVTLLKRNAYVIRNLKLQRWNGGFSVVLTG